MFLKLYLDFQNYSQILRNVYTCKHYSKVFWKVKSNYNNEQFEKNTIIRHKIMIFLTYTHSKMLEIAKSFPYKN